MAKAPSADDDIFALRLERSAPDLWPMLEHLYGQHPGYDAFKTDLLATLRKGWAARPGRCA